MRGVVLALGVLAMLAAVAGCYDENLRPCGQLLCPRDRVCHAPTGSCVVAEALTACAGIVDRTPCEYPGQSEGVCRSGLCEPARCGDGVRNGTEECDDGELNSDASDASCRVSCRRPRCGDGIADLASGEACDDGNSSNGDGCASDCRSLETCGNGIVDPAAGEQCDDGNRIAGDGCQDGCLFPRCGDGVKDTSLNEGCDEGSNNSLLSDACRPNCQLARCGDGVRDLLAGELCDDGNLDPGDGCRPDCKSNEVCGNGILDVLQGELCDDNQRARDGCSACRPETLRTRILGITPAPRIGAAMTYDAGRQRVVMFGGQLGGVSTNETWEWDGASWELKHPTTSPPARQGTQIVYDVARHRVVLFGGRSSSAVYEDTWLWDGTEWTVVPLVVRPPPRSGHALAYDAARHRVVLYGSDDARTDTWEWDGSVWAEVPTAASPQPSAVSLSMAYDPLRRETVLYNGAFDATWVYDGTTWTSKTPQTVPTVGMGGYTVSFDVARGVIVLVGPDAWEWNGTNWASVPAIGSRTNAAVAYDIARKWLVVHGGVVGGLALSDTWRRSGLVWSDVTTPVHPSPRFAAAAMYDPVRDRVVVFGGRDPQRNALSDTWEWDGHRWTQLATTGPSARGHATFTYDEGRRRGLLMGGAPADGYNNPGLDAWTWDGTTWAPTDAPPASSWGWMVVYDRARQRSVMVSVPDTYERSTAWSQINSSGPSPRYNAAMAYDARRGVSVLFGGRVLENGDRLGDTWQWDGTTWTERPNTSTLQARRGHAMTFSPQRGRVVLVGGDTPDVRFLDDLWEWTGSTWSQPSLTPPITGRYRPAFAAHASTGTLVILGGRGDLVPLDETVILEYQPNAAPEACTSATLDYDNDGLAGCADPDCALQCAPLCSPDAPCTTSPRCGDGTCDPAETCRWCPSDCGACPNAVCGDTWCDAPETGVSCPADC